MHTKTELPRIVAVDPLANAVDGQVVWSPLKSIWFLTHLTIAVVGGFITWSPSAVLVFVSTTAITLCLGHSLGMHRRLIHNSYQCPLWLEYLFVHLGVLVGLAGPLGMVRVHDTRDWAQRQPACHPYLRHGAGLLRDGWWQLNCDLKLTHEPIFCPEARLKNDRVFKFMEQTWMLQQLPLAALLFLAGGWPWVVWGISCRVCVSVAGHWFVGYFAHNHGEMDNEVAGAAVQGHNVKWVSVVSMGESWHNNHHAYPGSAILGIYKNQCDPGWEVLKLLRTMGWVWGVVYPGDLPERTNLNRVNTREMMQPAEFDGKQ